MKTRLTWKETGASAKVLKLDDTTFDHLPTADEHVAINDIEYRVAGIESAIVLLEPIPAPTHVEDTHADTADVVVRPVQRAGVARPAPRTINHPATMHHSTARSGKSIPGRVATPVKRK